MAKKPMGEKYPKPPKKGSKMAAMMPAKMKPGMKAKKGRAC